MRSRKGARTTRRKRATPFKRNGYNLLPAQKKQCYEEANIDSNPIYVELLTCYSVFARQLPAAATLRDDRLPGVCHPR
jgi:hypothetical protein